MSKITTRVSSLNSLTTDLGSKANLTGATYTGNIVSTGFDLSGQYSSLHFGNAASGDLHMDVEPNTRNIRIRNWNGASPNMAVTSLTVGTIYPIAQPYFCVGSMTHVSGGAWKSGTVLANRGSWGYDSATGIITVPSGISGLFEISTHMLYNTANTAANGGQMVLRVNGAFCDEAFASTGANPLMTTGCSQIRALAGGDQITVTATSGGWYPAATGNVISVKFLG